MALVTRLLCGHAVELIAGLPVLLLLATPVVVHAQNGEAVAREARKITVRLEGATQGSGVLVNRQGNQYTVLTAWHVVADQRPGEEMAIITPDGSQHPLDQGSVRRVGIVDMAVLTFTSISNYNVVNLGDPTSVALGGTVYVSGYPLADQAIPIRSLRKNPIAERVFPSPKLISC